jgi:hypothetical protein
MWMIVTIIITSHEAGCLTNTLIHSRSAAARVTRLGEFSPIWHLFSLGSYLKILEVAQILGLLLPHGTSYV